MFIDPKIEKYKSSWGYQTAQQGQLLEITNNIQKLF